MSVEKLQKSLRFIAQKTWQLSFKKILGLPPGLLLSRKTGWSTKGGFGHNTQSFYEGTISRDFVKLSITDNPHEPT